MNNLAKFYGHQEPSNRTIIDEDGGNINNSLYEKRRKNGATISPISRPNIPVLSPDTSIDGRNKGNNSVAKSSRSRKKSIKRRQKAENSEMSPVRSPGIGEDQNDELPGQRQEPV